MRCLHSERRHGGPAVGRPRRPLRSPAAHWFRCRPHRPAPRSRPRPSPRRGGHAFTVSDGRHRPGGHRRRRNRRVGEQWRRLEPLGHSGRRCRGDGHDPGTGGNDHVLRPRGRQHRDVRRRRALRLRCCRGWRLGPPDVRRVRRARLRGDRQPGHGPAASSSPAAVAVAAREALGRERPAVRPERRAPGRARAERE